MKNKTIAIIVLILLVMGGIYAISPLLSYWSLKEAIREVDTRKVDDLVQGAVLKFTLKQRIRDILYEELLANRGEMLKDLEKASLRTTATMLAEARVTSRVNTGQLVYVILDPLLKDEKLFMEINLTDAHEFVSGLLEDATTRRHGTNKYVVSIPIPMKDGSINPVELWFNRYGTVWRITDVKYAVEVKQGLDQQTN
jgi:hypothetical protein